MRDTIEKLEAQTAFIGRAEYNFSNDFEGTCESDDQGLQFSGTRLRRIPLRAIPKARPFDHTMANSLTRYVEGKLACEVLDAAAATRMKVLILGLNGLNSSTREIVGPEYEPLSFSYIKPSKELNFMRPNWLHAADGHDPDADALILHVFPGIDYTRHIASLVLDALSRRTSAAEQMIDVICDLAAEFSLPAWTRLPDLEVPHGCVFVLGFVDTLSRESNSSAKLIFENEFYKIWKLGDRVRLLGCKFSFWGRISARLTRELCKTGRIQHVIYFGKLGTLTTPSDLYGSYFSPSAFMVASGTHLITAPFSLNNPLAERYPFVRSGCHASVPTIVEETFDQRDLLSRHGTGSLDNEIAFIAREIYRYNVTNNANVAFSPFHYATDYIRDRREWFLSVPFDLANGREPLTIMKRSALHKRMAIFLLEYLSEFQ